MVGVQILVYENPERLKQSLEELAEKIKADSTIDRVRFMQWPGKRLEMEIYHKDRNVEKIKIENKNLDKDEFDKILKDYLIGEIGTYAFRRAKESIKEYVREKYSTEVDDTNIDWFDSEGGISYVTYTLEYERVILEVAYRMTIQERYFYDILLYEDFVYIITDKYNVAKIFYPF